MKKEILSDMLERKIRKFLFLPLSDYLTLFYPFEIVFCFCKYFKALNKKCSRKPIHVNLMAAVLLFNESDGQSRLATERKS